MPSEVALNNVPSLSFFAYQQLALDRSMINDFNFLKNIVSASDKCLELNGYNTRMLRDAGFGITPKAKIIYLPVIDYLRFLMIQILCL